MKRSQLIALSALALLLLSAAPVQQVAGQTAYSEKLNVFVAGNSALWYFTFSGVNGSSKMAAFESTGGLSWYNLTMVGANSWQSDFQIFGPSGYGVLPVPSVPSQGMFLTLGSDSYSDASAAASALGPYLFTTFQSYSNGTGTYSFYSPLSFNKLAPATLLKLLPTGEGGFVNALTAAGLESTAFPFVTLEGQKTSAGMNHDLVVGSMTASALDSGSRPNILGYFGSTVPSLQASSHASSSVVQVRLLDGIVKSTDPATVTNDATHFTGSYTLDLAQGKKVTRFNATVAETPDPLLATRTADIGVLRTNDTITITLSLKNLASAGTITKVSFSDDWWNTTGVFKFLGGNYTVPNSAIGAGKGSTLVYRLRYTGTGVGSVTMPASVVRYTYSVGAATFNATAVLNPIRLSLGADDAVLETMVAPIGKLGQPVGAQQSLNVTVTNIGTQSASSVSVAGHSITGLAASGSSSVTVTASAASFLGVNSTRSYLTTYQGVSGTPLNSTSNVIPLVFSHASMKVGSPLLSVSARLMSLANHITNLTLVFSTSNAGSANFTSFVATGRLPAGLGCGQVTGKSSAVNGFTCSGGVVTIDYPVVNASSTLTVSMRYNLTAPLNYIVAPMAFSSRVMGISFNGSSNAVGVPAGLVVTKEFSPSQFFGGMSANVIVSAVNSGPLSVYNVSVASNIDSFDTLAGNSVLTKSSAALGPGASLNFSYGVLVAQVSGSLNGSAASAGFFFGGASYSVPGAVPQVVAYQPLSVSIFTTPTTPQEGKDFTITFKINNPSGVAVTNVLFTLPVPSGLDLTSLQNVQVSGGVLTFAPGDLAAHSSATGTATAVASSGITIPFDKGKLTFQYSGVTINGVLPSKGGIAIAEDVTTRYIIPTAIILIAVLAVAFYVRRMAAPIAPASPK